MSHILHVVVVGFHHKKGCQVEFSYPPLNGPGENGLPEYWVHLPSLAIPDGAHSTDSDVIYFTLPSHEEPGKSVFGISCYRQIAAKELISKTDDVTRSTVQKSVCVLSRVPLYGVLKAKLQLITQAYFNELDFAKVEVLSQMHNNLCEMFEGDLVDGHAASMDISVQNLFRRFRHRALMLFKLMLLERKVVFNISPVSELGDIMMALLSICPRLLEEGILYCPVHIKKQQNDSPDDLVCEEDPIRNHDSYGFPLSIFTQGNIFCPYLSISYLDTIRSSSTRAFMIGATNALFVTKKESLDAVVTVDEFGIGQLEVVNVNLRKVLSLTSADLRFGDFLMKNIEMNFESSSLFDGGDEWIRLQMRGYLLALAATARSDLQTAVADYGTAFVFEWRNTKNYTTWMLGGYEDLSGSVPGHSFAGQLGLNDIRLRVEHSVSGSDGARKAFTALSATGKNIGETGSKVKQSLSSWFKGTAPAVEAKEIAPETEASRYITPSSSSDNVATPSFTQESDQVSQHSQSSQLSDTRPSEGVTFGSKVKTFASWFKGRRQNSQEGEPEVAEEATASHESVNEVIKKPEGE